MDHRALADRVASSKIVSSSVLSLVVVVALLSQVNAAHAATEAIGPNGLLVVDAPADKGFVFIDGQYVERPYVIERRGIAVAINGREFTAESLDLSAYEYLEDERSTRGRRAGPGFRPGFGGGRSWRRPPVEQASFNGGQRRERMSRTPMDRFVEEVRSVGEGLVVVLYSDQPPMCLWPSEGGYELILSLSRDSQAAAAQSDSGEVQATQSSYSYPERLQRESDLVAWNRLVSEFEPSEPFMQHVTNELAKYEVAAEDGERVMASMIWLDRLSYPLTVFAMAVVVLGFGHLLSNKPKLEGEAAGDDDWSKRKKVVGQSLVIVALLSAVDLVWTILASNSGAMRELNPLGSNLISDPTQLVLFKATVTSTSLGILYVLHRRPVAQVASWWCCLLLTLLTARWVVFQSMFL